MSVKSQTNRPELQKPALASWALTPRRQKPALLSAKTQFELMPPVRSALQVAPYRPHPQV